MLAEWLGAPADSDARRDVRARQTTGLELGTLFSVIIVVLVGVFLLATDVGWPVGFWMAAMAVVIPGPILAKRCVSDFEKWIVSAGLGEAAVGAVWGSVAVVAMPGDDYWRAVLCAVLTAVIVGGAMLGGELDRLHLLFIIPLTTAAVVGFIWHGDVREYFLALMLVLGCAFSALLAGESADLHSELSELSRRNARYAEGLAAEHERLQRSNASLEAANLRLDEQARRDDLTGLANRLSFTEALEVQLQRLREGENSSVTVAYLDLDGFKQINDGMGHSAGDRLLQAIGDRLSAVVRDNELLARLGGDELTLLSPEGEPAEVGERILSAFSTPFMIGGRPVPAGASVGLATASADVSSDDLLRYADEALYQAKDRGGWRYAIFDAPMRVRYEQRRSYEAEVGDALERGEIRPWLQPVVDFETGRIISAEALARWEHPEGTRSANTFIEAVASLGLLDTMTRRFVREIESVNAELVDNGIHDLKMALNVPPAHLERLLQHFQGSPALKAVIVELTEESAFGNVGRARELLQQAREAGLQIHLDDFGVGFSSLSIATRLPVDGLKIDRSFVSRIATSASARAVIASVVDLANRMDVEVIAEGVETVDQFTLLRDLGVRQGQGWLFAAAVPASDFVEWIVEGRRFALSQLSTPQSPLAAPVRVQ